MNCTCLFVRGSYEEIYLTDHSNQSVENQFRQVKKSVYVPKIVIVGPTAWDAWLQFASHIVPHDYFLPFWALGNQSPF